MSGRKKNLLLQKVPYCDVTSSVIAVVSQTAGTFFFFPVANTFGLKGLKFSNICVKWKTFLFWLVFYPKTQRP